MSYPYDQDWRRVRAAVLVRDEHRCQLRLPGCKLAADEVDHVTPLSQGGARLDPANLRAACKSCNVAAGNMMRDGGRFEPAGGWCRGHACRLGPGHPEPHSEAW